MLLTISLETIAAVSKFSQDRPLVIDVLRDITNRNRENENRVANKALALAGTPKRKGRPRAARHEETLEPIILPKMPARDAPVPAAYDTRPREDVSDGGAATEEPADNTTVVVPGVAAKRKRQPLIAITLTKSCKKNNSTHWHSGSESTQPKKVWIQCALSIPWVTVENVSQCVSVFYLTFSVCYD